MIDLHKSAVPSKSAASANINVVDTSIKHPVSGQSTTMVKDCMYIMFIADTAFSYGRASIDLLISSEIFQARKKVVCM